MRRLAGTALALRLMLSASPSTANASTVTPTKLAPISITTQKSTVDQDQTLTTAGHSRKARDTLVLYSSFTFNGDATGIIHGDRFPWASFTETQPGDRATIQVRVAVSSTNQSIITIQHVKIHSIPGESTSPSGWIMPHQSGRGSPRKIGLPPPIQGMVPSRAILKARKPWHPSITMSRTQ